MRAALAVGSCPKATIHQGLRGIGGVRTEVVGASLFVVHDAERLVKNAQKVAADLGEGTPRIIVRTFGEERIGIGSNGPKEREKSLSLFTCSEDCRPNR